MPSVTQPQPRGKLRRQMDLLVHQRMPNVSGRMLVETLL